MSTDDTWGDDLGSTCTWVLLKIPYFSCFARVGYIVFSSLLILLYISIQLPYIMGMAILLVNFMHQAKMAPIVTE